MEEILDTEIDDFKEPEWKEHALEIGRNFFIVYGVLSLIRNVVKFVCRK